MKYGKGNVASSSESSSSSSDEDSDAELLNPTVEKKFIEVINAIRTNDPTLKQSDKPLFDDADFIDESGSLKNTAGAKSKFTLKDQIRKHALKKLKKADQSGSESDSSDDDEDVDDSQQLEKGIKPKESKLFTKIGVSKHDEEAAIKREFKKQADLEVSSDGDSDGFLKLKSKHSAGSDSESDDEDDKGKSGALRPSRGDNRDQN